MAESIHGRILNEVAVSSGDLNSVITVSFNFPVQYLRHFPLDYGKEVRIRLKPILINKDDLNAGRETLYLPSQSSSGAVRVEYEARDSIEATLTVTYDGPRQFAVQQGEDFRSLTIRLSAKENEKPAYAKKVSKSIPEIESSVDPDRVDSPPNPWLLTQERQESLLQEGLEAMTQRNYLRAVQIYTKLLESEDPEIQESALFQLALAQEYAGHLAHARAEYKNYLTTYPDGPKSKQADDRLKNLLNSRPLREGESMESQSSWKSEFFGSLSQFYYRDASFVSDEENDNDREELVNVSSLLTGIDSVWRLQSQNYRLETVVVGSFEEDLSGNRDDEIRGSALYFDFRNNDNTFSSRWGRQSGSNAAGVLGRFDGGRFSYILTEKVRLNLVAGFPVERSYDNLETDKYFQGISFDFGRFFQRWDFSSYFIDQVADGIADRRALGTEIKYIGDRGSFFSLFDYDILFNEMSMFLFAGNWLLPNDTTRLYFSGDYRGNPIFSASNALIGQVSPSLKELEKSIGKDEVLKLAEDRTLNSRYATFGAFHTVTEDIQISGDISWSKLDGGPASGGVEAMESTGDEFYYSAQLINNNLVREGDISTLGLRYADTRQRDVYGLRLSTRQLIDVKLRITPRLEAEIRSNKLQSGEQWRLRPGLLAEYFLNRQWRFEVDGEYSWADKELPGVAEDKYGYIISVGLYYDF